MPDSKKKRKTNKVQLFIIGSRKSRTSERDANTSTGKKNKMWSRNSGSENRELLRLVAGYFYTGVSTSRSGIRPGREAGEGREAAAPGGRMPAAI